MKQVVFALFIDEIDTKQPKIHRKIRTSLWILKTKSNQKSRDFCQMFVISKKKAKTLGKENHTVGFGFKIFSNI
jgi:hypothetical protein